MTKKTRYLLLLGGFIFFLIMAPIIVLYVRGVTYDFTNRKFVKTGILAVRVSPSHVNVFVNEEQKRTSEGDIKFLKPKEYQITLKKVGYFDWTKRLVIEEGKVSWTTNGNSKIFLLKNDFEKKLLAQEIVDFNLYNNRLIYLTNSEIVLNYQNNNEVKYHLPKKVNSILTAKDNYIALINNQAESLNSEVIILNSDTGEFFDLGLFNNEVLETLSLQNGFVYYLNDSQLFRTEIKNKQTIAILSNITSYFTTNNSVYYIQKNANIKNLYASNLELSQTQILLENLPYFSNEKLYITFGKQILILADKDLFLANSELKKIVSNVTNFKFSPTEEVLPVIHSGQLDYYNTFTQELSIVTRSTETLENINVAKNIGYAFYTNSNGLNAIELDTRDKQNHYLLQDSSKIKNFSVLKDQERIIYLEDTNLYEIKIR